MKKFVDNVVPEDLLRVAQERALKLFAKTISCTYGPLGGITAFAKTTPDGKTMAIAQYTKDGFHVHSNIQVDMPIEALIKDEIEEICRAVVKGVGDGTTTAIMLSYQIFSGMMKLYKSGMRKRAIINTFQRLVKELNEAIIAKKRECTLDDIYRIALTSLNGNADMAANIQQIYKNIGMDVFIDVQGGNTKDTVVKQFDGMIYDNGYLDDCFINDPERHVCDFQNPHIYLFDSPVDTPTMLSLVQLIVKVEIEEPNSKLQQAAQNGTLQKMIANGKQPHVPDPVVIFAPYFSRDANSYLDQLISIFRSCPVQQRNRLCIVQTGNADPNKLIDICNMSGARFIKKYIDPEQFKIDQKKGLAPSLKNIVTFHGTCERIIIDKLQTKIVNPKMMRDENYEVTTFYNNYIDALQDQLEKLSETNNDPVEIGKLRRRINILKGTMVDMYVGGIGTSDKKSLTDAVEDAVLNCRSAAKEGVGYGASFDALSEAAKLANKYADSNNKEEVEVAKLLLNSYFNIVTALYLPYYEDVTSARSYAMRVVKGEVDSPFNMITETYDGNVLTSIMTEPTILDAISRIITVLFNTNQFLLPTPQFNIYTMEDSQLIIRPDGKKEKVEEDKEESNDEVFDYVFPK